jgi:hypothetical protein
MRKTALFTIFGLLFFAGCENPPPRTTTVDFAQPQAAEDAKDQELGSGIRVKFITSTSPIRSHERIQADVQRQLESFINGGQYEIVRVVTTRCNDPGAHLLSAEVYYRPKK